MEILPTLLLRTVVVATGPADKYPRYCPGRNPWRCPADCTWDPVHTRRWSRVHHHKVHPQYARTPCNTCTHTQYTNISKTRYLSIIQCQVVTCSNVFIHLQDYIIFIGNFGLMTKWFVILTIIRYTIRITYIFIYFNLVTQFNIIILHSI